MTAKTTTVTPAEMVSLLSRPEARAAAARAGWSQGVEVDVQDLAAGMAQHGYYVTADLAWEVGRRSGSNLRCNRCGTYGATWISGERPGWGDLALCPPHADALAVERRRHETALRELRKVNFEQPTRPAPRSPSRHDDW